MAAITDAEFRLNWDTLVAERDALRAKVAEVEAERDAALASLGSASVKLAEARNRFMILVGKFGWDRDSSHGPSRRHPGLRLYTSREPQGRAPYYKQASNNLRASDHDMCQAHGAKHRRLRTLENFEAQRSFGCPKRRARRGTPRVV